MLGLIGVIKAIGEVFKFAGTLTDSAQRRERYELLLDKQAHKALNSAETIIHSMDSYLAETISLRQFKYIFNKHKRIFFKND
jgi:hypothetical protein